MSYRDMVTPSVQQRRIVRNGALFAGAVSALATGLGLGAGSLMSSVATPSPLTFTLIGMGSVALASGVSALGVARLCRSLLELQATPAETVMDSNPVVADPRAQLETLVEASIASSARRGTTTGVMLLSVDRMSEIRLGLGDVSAAALDANVTSRLREITRKNEPAIRLDGDVFAIVIENPVDRHDDQRFAKRLLDQLEPVVAIGQEQLKVSLSIGISRQTTSPTTAGQLVRQAEIALHDARSQHGEKFSIYDEAMDDLVFARSRIANDLAAAIHMRDHLSMVYQPVFAFARGELLGAEALLRWNHPILGRLDTRLLIDVAEETGIVTELGDWTLSTVFDHLSRSPVPWVAVNIAPDHLKSEGFLDTLRLRLSTTKIYPARLHLELPLAVFLDEALTGLLNEISALGVELVVDHLDRAEDLVRSPLWQNSSLQMIRTIKFSATTLQGSDSDVGHNAALWSILRSARSRNIKLAAKDVETSVQNELLDHLGVNEVQGRWYAPPTTALTIDTLARVQVAA